MALERDALERGESRVVGGPQHLQRSQSHELLETLVHPDDRESVGSPAESPVEDADVFDAWMPFDFSGAGGASGINGRALGSRGSRPTSKTMSQTSGDGGNVSSSVFASAREPRRSRSVDVAEGLWSSIADGDIGDTTGPPLRGVRETTM